MRERYYGATIVIDEHQAGYLLKFSSQIRGFLGQKLYSTHCFRPVSFTIIEINTIILTILIIVDCDKINSV